MSVRLSNLLLGCYLNKISASNYHQRLVQTSNAVLRQYLARILAAGTILHSAVSEIGVIFCWSESREVQSIQDYWENVVCCKSEGSPTPTTD